MNLLLLENQDFLSSDLAQVSGRRHQHIQKVLRSKVGDSISIGQLNGCVGKAQISEVSPDATQLKIIHLEQSPPDTIPLTIILGLPRPRMLQRTLQTIATMGVERLCLIQTSRVEKSFWQTPLLKPETIKEQLILGLEQGKATQLPIIEMHPRFRPFAEDVLPNQYESNNKVIAHPGDYPHAGPADHKPTTLAIGPEGGFIQKEVDYFTDVGFEPVQLGQRILRVETAIPVLIGKLF